VPRSRKYEKGQSTVSPNFVGIVSASRTAPFAARRERLPVINSEQFRSQLYRSHVSKVEIGRRLKIGRTSVRRILG